MPQLHVLKVFVGDEGVGGNPLGVFLDGSEIPEDSRQRMAADLGFSETVFVNDTESGALHIFTPENRAAVRRTPACWNRLALGERTFGGVVPASASR